MTDVLIPDDRTGAAFRHCAASFDAAPNDRYLVVYRKLSGRRAF
jgi:hypothetical protein